MISVSRTKKFSKPNFVVDFGRKSRPALPCAIFGLLGAMPAGFTVGGCNILGAIQVGKVLPDDKFGEPERVVATAWFAWKA